MPESTKLDKPFLTYEQMIQKLKYDYELQITNENFAKHALQTFSYYNLINGYQECFRDKNTNKFINDTTIEFLCRFHYFDKNFQHIFLKYCTYIEDTFKNHLSYVLSKDFGVKEQDYLNPRNYRKVVNGEKRSKNISTTLDNIKKELIQHSSDPTKYYFENHNHIPAWILFKNINFTDAIDLYSFLKKEQKEQVVQFFFPNSPLEMEQQKEFLKVSITLVRKFRNKIAHNLKYYSFRPSYPKFSTTLLKPIALSTPLLTTSEVKKQTRGVNDVYAFLISIINLLGTPDLISSLFEDIVLLIQIDNENSKALEQEPLFHTYSQITGLPIDLTQRLNQYYIENFK